MIQDHRRGSKVSACAFTSLLLLILTISEVAAGRLDPRVQKPYYGRELYQKLVIRNSYPDLVSDLHRILSSSHLAVDGDFDEIVTDCDGDTCYSHVTLHHRTSEAYKQARKYLFGMLHLRTHTEGLTLTEVYCNITYTEDDFSEEWTLGPMRIPNYRVVNAEHTRPQSHFSKNQSKLLQKTDLHALFPAKSGANSSRSNHDFGEVDEVISSQCPGAYLGYAQGGGDRRYFEPPDNHKGNVARALFYFATRYELPIRDFQESFLRDWHRLDPVDQDEFDRHEHIFEIQKTRNPYIDHPELVDLVENF